MPYLTHELLKNCTSLVKLEHLNDLCSNLCGFSSDVYGLRAEFGYPSHLMSRTNKNFIAYIGIHKNKLETSYGQAHFITFYHEPKSITYGTELGILNYMYDIYMDNIHDELSENGYKENENFSVELFPYRINSKNCEYWRTVIEGDWGVCDKISLEDLIDDYELRSKVNWDELYNILPENIDDMYDDDELSDDEGSFIDEEETDDELEEAEILMSDSDA